MLKRMIKNVTLAVALISISMIPTVCISLFGFSAMVNIQMSNGIIENVFLLAVAGVAGWFIVTLNEEFINMFKVFREVAEECE